MPQNKATFVKEIIDPSSWQEIDYRGDILECIFQHFDGKLPANTHVYLNSISKMTDITPVTPADVEKLKALDGHFYIVEYPADLVTAAYYALAFVAGLLAVTLLAKAPPTPTLRNTTTASPNNELSERVNSARPNGRIPDIFGTVRSTPDLIAAPYNVFVGNREVEFALMCIGRGYYDIEDIRDGDTLIESISQAGAKIYGPGTSPNGGSPQAVFGTTFTEPIYSVNRVNAVNGQLLKAPNAGTVKGSEALTFEFVVPNKIKVATDAGVDFTDYFAEDDTLTIAESNVANSEVTSTTVNANVRFYQDGTIEWASGSPDVEFEVGGKVDIFGAYILGTSSAVDLNGANYTIGAVGASSVTLTSPATINPQWDLIEDVFSPNTYTDYIGVSFIVKSPVTVSDFDLDGTYTVLAVSDHEITLFDPDVVNPNWTSFGAHDMSAIKAKLSIVGDLWIGPFVIDNRSVDFIYNNFVALNGLYKDNGETQLKVDVTLEIEITPVDANGDPTGAAQLTTFTLNGSATSTETVGATQKLPIGFSDRVSIRVRRLTDTDFDFKGNVVDEIKWRDALGVKSVAISDFGNVTLVQTRTFATAGALSVKSRKNNMLVTRKLPARVGSTSAFTSELYPTNNVADIFCAVALDAKIGGRTLAELDIAQIYATIADVVAYFGTTDAAEFCYTFDSVDLSFEDTITTIAQAAFCETYRRGPVFRLMFEKLQTTSRLLFNSRNKVPGSEQRTHIFGRDNDYDGVSFKWVNPDDDAIETIYIPEDRSAIKNRDIESVGVRNYRQAYFHAWRARNRIWYKNTVVKFDATAESQLLVRQERILVSDNTRPNSQDGEVEAQDGFLLTLSQPIDFEDGAAYTMWLQLPDASTQAVGVVPTDDPYQVTIDAAPTLPLVLEEDRYANTTFMIVKDDSPRQLAFLMTERGAVEGLTASLSAVNYDDRYYANDKDYIDNVID